MRGNDYLEHFSDRCPWGICETTRDALIAVSVMNGVMLYIDDNEDNIFLLQRLFKHRYPDIELRTAMTGRDGIRAAIDGQPALILLDNRLPDVNGKQVLGQLAATPATAAIPVIILSGDSDPASVDELLAAGAADFLVKPFDIHRLLAVVGRYLR